MQTPLEVLRNWATILGYQVPGFVAMALAALLAAFVVPPQVFSEYYIMLSAIHVVSGVALSWIAQAVVLFAKEQLQRGGDGREVLASSLLLQAAVLAPILVVGWLIRPLLPEAMGVSVPAFVIIAFTIVVMAAFESVSYALQASRQFHAIGLGASISKFGLLAVMLAIAAGLTPRPHVLVAGVALGFTAALVVTYSALPKGPFHVALPTLRTMTRIGVYGWRLSLAAAAAVLTAWMHIWFVRAYSGPLDAGVYAWAASLHALVFAALLPLSAVMASDLIELALKDSRQDVERRLNQFLATAALSAVAMPAVLGSMQIAVLALPHEYAGAGAILAVLLSVVPAQLMNTLSAPIRRAYPAMVGSIAAIHFLSLLLSAVLNLLLTANYGGRGAALAYSLTMWCSACAMQYRFGRVVGQAGRGVEVLVICGLASTLAAVVISILPPVAALACGFVLSGLYLVLGRSAGLLDAMSYLTRHLDFLPLRLRQIAAEVLVWCSSGSRYNGRKGG